MSYTLVLHSTVFLQGCHLPTAGIGMERPVTPGWEYPMLTYPVCSCHVPSQSYPVDKIHPCTTVSELKSTFLSLCHGVECGRIQVELGGPLDSCKKIWAIKYSSHNCPWLFKWNSLKFKELEIFLGDERENAYTHTKWNSKASKHSIPIFWIFSKYCWLGTVLGIRT